MTEIFANYLKSMRNRKMLTQQQVVDHLVDLDPLLGGLDKTTYSRWERGVTAPKVSKQILVARSFGDDITRLVAPSVSKFQNASVVLDEFRGQYLDPYWLGYEGLATKESNLATANRNSISRIKAFHEHYLEINFNEKLYDNQNITIKTVEDSTGYLLAHLLMTFIPSTTPNKHLEELHLESCSFTTLDKSKDEPLSLYLISSFSSVPEFRLTTVLRILELLTHHTKIKYVILNCHTQVIYNIFESSTEFDIIAKGSRVKNRGIKLFGKQYSYIRIKIKSESFLATKLFLELTPYMDALMNEFQLKY
ncbi:helix-turn-helix transcriptional regulator [Vibrio jasicida]|uniref:helix-turn-helix transcriptional regulator n=1 Tax=Vibrio jasicida TaxID=766224 RepID=UPI0003A7EEBB|nr:helix-turn-helix transcriptional regulator [Vibrio jasicida]